MMPAARRLRLAELTGAEPVSDPIQTVIALDLDELRRGGSRPRG